MKSIVLLLLPLFLFFDHADEAISTNQIQAKNPYIQNNTAKEFLASETCLQKIDPELFDEDVLVACLYFLLNDQRPKSQSSLLETTSALHEGAKYLLSKCSYSRIKYAIRKHKAPARKWEYMVREKGFKGAYLAMSTATLPLYEYPKRFHYRSDKSVSPPTFYYLERKKRVDLVPHSYLSMAKKLLKLAYYSGAKDLIKSKALKEWTCVVRIEQQEEGRMPYMSMLMVGGGYRLDRLK